MSSMKKKLSITLSEKLLEKIEDEKPDSTMLSAWLEKILRERYKMKEYNWG